VIKDANVVLYDKLVDDRIVALVPDGTELLDVGKDSNLPHGAAAQINELLVSYARQGKTVVRLKEVIPSCLSRRRRGSGTDDPRRKRGGCAWHFISGRRSCVCRHTGHAPRLRLKRYHYYGSRGRGQSATGDVLAQLDGTLVVLMGVGTLAENVENLVACGKDVQTPAAIIAQGTTPRQKVVVGTLIDIAHKAKMPTYKPQRC